MNKDRIRVAACALITSATEARAVWARKAGVFPKRFGDEGAVITCRIARGPTLRQSERLSVETPTSVLWTIADPVAETRVGIRAADVQVHADLGLAPDAEAARDALYDTLVFDTLGPALLPDVAITQVGTDSIRLSGALGSLYCAEAFGSGASLAIETYETAQAVTGRAEAILEFAAFGASDGAEANDLLGELALALRSLDVDVIETQTGVDFARHPAGDIVDLTSTVGATWESRAVVRVAVHLRLYRAVPIEAAQAVSFDRVRVTRADGTGAGIPVFDQADT